jgi:DNA-binding protein HU-beta
MAQSRELTKKQCHAMLEEVVGALTGHLAKGDKVRMSGILEVKNRPERMGRNPATGEAIKIAASKKIAFRAAKELKEAV